MAKVEIEHVFEGSQAQVFAAIRSYEKYPDYIQGVSRITVLPAKVSASTCQVRYELNLIKTFFYVLDMFEDEPNRIHWHLDESNLMKQSDGSWDLSEISSGKTKALYALDVKFKGLVPSAVTDRVAKANLPAMMEGFQRLIKDQAR